ncbi:MAG: DNA methyltransferase, partial [Candidatus Margulisbacteria bacterium]|nr:DNA methyltransferase [Candidatus Margulisiibacteriota bacterium]
LPLYLYHEDGTKTSNLKKEIVDKIKVIVGKTSPEDVFDYIYCVLHSPSYRDKYKEFLKIDFPRVPYPKDAKTFKTLVKLGAELRGLHLLESPKVNKFITTYPVAGSNVVGKISFKGGKVFVNKEQYFGKVPEIAWNFYIGGYQPAQKWLKDRKGRSLTNSDIEYYQKIIVALTETERIMGEIDKIGVVEGAA